MMHVVKPGQQYYRQVLGTKVGREDRDRTVVGFQYYNYQRYKH